MRRQSNLFCMKEHDRTSEKELDEMEISNLADKKSKLIVIKMLI